MAARKTTSPARKAAGSARTTTGSARRSTAKRRTRRKATRGPARGAAARIQQLTGELPPPLQDVSRTVQRRLNELERQIGRLRAEARQRALRLLRATSDQLGRLEGLGESSWGRLAEPARAQALRVAHQLEKSLGAPATGARRRTKATHRKPKRAVTGAASRDERAAKTAAEARSEAADIVTTGGSGG